MFLIVGAGFISGLTAALVGWGQAQIRWRQQRYIQELKREQQIMEELANE